eukprot:scaffold13009_cov165-Isochrysis_galbana.AAC.1
MQTPVNTFPHTTTTTSIVCSLRRVVVILLLLSVQRAGVAEPAACSRAAAAPTASLLKRGTIIGDSARPVAPSCVPSAGCTGPRTSFSRAPPSRA